MILLLLGLGAVVVVVEGVRYSFILYSFIHYSPRTCEGNFLRMALSTVLVKVLCSIFYHHLSSVLLKILLRLFWHSSAVVNLGVRDYVAFD